MAFSEVITYDTSGSFSFDPLLIEVSGGVIRLKDLGGATYSTANPSVTTQHKNMLSSLSSFAQSASIAGSDNVKHALVINGSNYWYNTGLGQWEASDGTYSESNTATEINANAATLFSGLGLSGAVYLSLLTFLHSNDGTTRPSLTSNTLGYGFSNPTPAVISECTLSCYVGDLLGEVPTYNAAEPVVLYVGCDRAFFHGNKLIQPFTKTANFNSSGFASISVIETQTPGVKLSFGISFFDGISRKQVKLFSAIVPNSASQDLNLVTLVRYQDFG